ncbi:MAG: hypothetical protein RL636_1154 [Verrucomicrobiota bacterium]
MNRFVGIAAGLLLVGCAVEPPTPASTVEPGGEFGRPTGASRNPRLGFVGQNPTATGPQLLLLARTASELSLKKDELVVSRSRDLRPTALLRIVEIRGQAALAVPLRGRPGANEEIVLPSSPLRQQAEALPPAPPGS